jgi:hypothetical protein
MEGKEEKQDRESGEGIRPTLLFVELENYDKWKRSDLYDVPRKSTKSSVGDATICEAYEVVVQLAISEWRKR